MSDRFLAASIAMRTSEGKAELVFAQEDDRYLALQVMKLPNGREFLEALGTAAHGLDKRFTPKAHLSLAVPPSSATAVQTREQDRGRNGKDGPAR